MVYIICVLHEPITVHCTLYSDGFMEYTYSKITKIYIKHLVIKETISKTKKYSFLINTFFILGHYGSKNPIKNI